MQPVLKQKFPRDPERFAHDLRRHFRGPVKSVGENDGNLNDPQTLAPHLMRHLNLKAVATRVHALDVDRLKGPPPKAFEAAGRIAEGHSRDQLHIFGGAQTKHQPFERPVNNANAVAITGA